MKKIVLIYAALMAVTAVSCNKEKNENAPLPADGMKTLTLSVSVDDQLTKTSYENGTTFSWTKDDEISVLCSDDVLYTFKADESGTSTTFTGSVPTDVELGDRAYFPADDGHTASKFNIPQFKDLTFHPSADIPMVGKKGEGNTYSFTHCAGAALLTVNNIPDGIESIELRIENESLKLSGSFTISEDGDYYCWEPQGKDDAGNNLFIRKVSSVNHSAQLYIPYSSHSEYGNMWAKNSLSITGYNSSNAGVTLVNGKSMKALGTFSRACIKPLTPLVLSSLANIDWDSDGVTTSSLSPSMTSEDKIHLTELKAVADDYFLYLRVKSPRATFNSNYLDLYICDGAVGDQVVWYWNTTAKVVFTKEHNGKVTDSSLTMTYNGKSVDTVTTSDEDSIYWSMALPRSAHDLTVSSGTVYVGFRLLNGWNLTGVIPTCWTDMMAVSLP